MKGLEREKEIEQIPKIKMKKFYKLFLDSEKQKEEVKVQVREQQFKENQKIVKEALRLDEIRDRQREEFKLMVLKKQQINTIRNTKSQSHVLEKIEKENIRFLNQVKSDEKMYIIILYNFIHSI